MQNQYAALKPIVVAFQTELFELEKVKTLPSILREKRQALKIEKDQINDIKMELETFEMGDKIRIYYQLSISNCCISIMMKNSHK